MNVKPLIDGSVRQTTVLIAQLSTEAGIRAPLSHVADEVFVSLARELEAQGVGRKVVADIFGLALRTYQVKVQRLEESRTVRESTLWEAVLHFVRESGTVSRTRVLERFRLDGGVRPFSSCCQRYRAGASDGHDLQGTKEDKS